MCLVDELLPLRPHSNSAAMHDNTLERLPPGHRDASAVSFQEPSCISPSLGYYRGGTVLGRSLFHLLGAAAQSFPCCSLQQLFLADLGTSRGRHDTPRPLMLDDVTRSSCVLGRMTVTIIENKTTTRKQQAF